MIKTSLKLLIFSIFIPHIVFAFRLSPMVIHFSPKGSASTQILTLENPGSDKVPVQIEVFSREENEKGEEVRKKTEDFSVYPEQIVLLANEKRNVRITWAGEVAASEKSYRIVASQLPVEFRDRNAKPKKMAVDLKFLLQYVASAYVTPDGAVAKIKVKELKVLEPKKISVTLMNEGSAHKILHVKKLKIFSGEKLVADISEPKEFDGINMLVGSQKSVILTSPQGIVATSLRGEMELVESGD